jgi:hypothetical protein
VKVLAFAFLPVATTLGLCLLGYLLGRRLLIAAPEVLESPGAAAVCTSLGLGGLATLAGGLGLLHALRPWPLTLCLLAILAISGRAWPRFRRREPPAEAAPFPVRAAAALLVASFAVLALGVAVLALYPPTDFDAGAYHLAVARTYAREGAVTLTPYLRFPVGPLNAHMLFTLVLLPFDDPAGAALVSVAAAVLLGLAVFSWASDGGSEQTGFLAASLWATSTLVLNRAETASYHMVCALFCVMAVLCFVRFRERLALPWLVLAGTFAGLAVGTYYVGGFFAAALAVCAAWTCGRAERIRFIFVYALVAAVAAAPWLLRNAFYTGNPVWPALGHTLGAGPFWDGADLALVAADLRHLGLPRTLGNLLRAPYDVTMHPERFQPTGAISFALLAAWPLLAWGSMRDRSVAFLAAFSGVGFLAWWSGAQALRYLLPLLALVAVAGARAWIRLPIPEGRGWPRKPLLATVLALILLAPAYSWVAETSRQRGPLPTTRAEREAWLGTRQGGYDAAVVANRAPGPVYVYPGLPLGFALDGGSMGDLVGPARYRTVLPNFASGTQLHDALNGLGARYLLLYWPGDLETPADDESFSRWFDLRYSDSTSELFALRTEPAAVAWPPPERLADPGFESATAGAWRWTGTAEPTSEAAFVHEGRSAVSLGVAGSLAQSVPGNGGAGSCTLSFWARTRREPRPLRIVLDWRDENGAILREERRLASIGPSWQRLRSRHIGVARAASVGVTLEAAEGRVFVDEVSLHFSAVAP